VPLLPVGVAPLFHFRIFLLVAFASLCLKLPSYFLDFLVFISLSISSFTSFLRMNSRGWKSFSILSTSANSSRLTNLLNSVRSEFEVLFSLSRSCLISVFSCFRVFISSSISCLEDIRFFPKRRTLSLISLFLSSVSFSLVLKSDRRNFIWSFGWGAGAAIFVISLRSL